MSNSDKNPYPSDIPKKSPPHKEEGQNWNWDPSDEDLGVILLLKFNLMMNGLVQELLMEMKGVMKESILNINTLIYLFMIK